MAGLEGMRLGNFLILRRISGGGMGDIYLAEQEELGRKVAIKVIREGEARNPADASARARANLQFDQEARAVAALEHPHILPIYGLGEQDGVRYLAMQYVPDGSLADLLAPGPLHRLELPVPPALGADIVEQAAEAIQFAHDSGIIHRDIKPHNLLARVLSPADAPPQAIQLHVLLADFGLARFMAELTGRTGTTGTPLYSAPEQYQGQPVPATDQYALACVAYLLLAGRPVFDGTVVELHHQHLTVAPPPISQANPGLPAAVDDVLARALAKDPAARYPRIRDFARALRAALDPAVAAARSWQAATPPPAAPPPPTPTPTPIPAPLSTPLPRVVGAPAPATTPLGPPVGRALASTPLGAIQPRVVTPVRADARADARAESGGEGGIGSRLSPFGTATPSSRALAATAAGRTPSSGRREPDARGAPIPRRAFRRRPAGSPPRVSKRARSLGLAAVLILASVGTIAFIAWKRSQLPPFSPTQTVQITHSGQVSVGSLPQFRDGQQHAEATLPVRTLRSGTRDTTTGQNSALPAIPQAAAALGARADAPLIQTKFGLGQDQVGVSTPMDASVASGDQYIVEAVDGAIQIYGHDGVPDGPQIAAASLFAPVLQPNDNLGQPRVLFDEGSQRWILVMNETADAGGAVSAGFFDVAISKDARPISSWSVYQFSTLIAGYADCTYADAPQIGSDGAGIYITGNVFLCGADGAFKGAALWDLPKKAFVAGGATTIYRWFGQFDNAQHNPVFTLSPARESGADPTEWLVSNDAGYVDGGKTSKQVIVWAILNSAAVNQQQFPTLIGVVTSLPYAYADPPNAIQPGTSVVLDTGDTRVAGVYFAGGHLYTAFTTGVNWRGESAARAGIYWLDIQPRTIPPTAKSASATIGASVHQAGIYGYSGMYLYSPALAADAAGDLVLGAGVSSPDLAPGVLYSWRHGGDALNQLGANQMSYLLAAGTAAYPGTHWGDYSGVVLGTPASGGHVGSIWLAGTYMESRSAHWQTLVWELSLG